MKRARRYILIVAGILGIGVAGFGVLSASGKLDYDYWLRESPLINPIAVANVHDGVIFLADGRFYRPAGVSRSEGVSASDFDEALRVMTAQGVIVTRDLSDGRAFMIVEPKFYNWCGTRSRRWFGSVHWNGSYLQCPLSELLIQSAYASPIFDEAGLTASERWRLEGVEYFGSIDDSPRSLRSDALRYDHSVSCLDDYDVFLEVVWKAPPSP